MATYALDDVRINGYRWLRKLHLTGLGRVNLLVGRNNSGKTSTLEAVSILSNPLNPMEWLSVIRRRDFGRLDESRVQSLRWCLRQTGSSASRPTADLERCEMSCRGRFEIPSLVVTMRDIVGEPPPRERFHGSSRPMRPNEPEVRHGLEVIHTVSVTASELLQVSGTDGWVEERAPIWDGEFYATSSRSSTPSLPVEVLSPYSYQINRFQVRNLSRSIHAGFRPQIIELLRVFDPEIQDIDVLSLAGNRPAIYLKHRRLGNAPLSVFGDAIRRVTLLSSSIPQLEDGLLLIDEIETGVHVSSLPTVFNWLHTAATRHSVQVIATTHSLEAVDAMIGGQRPTSGDDSVAYHLEQEGTGTTVKRFDVDLLTRLRFERGLDVR